MVLPKAAAPPVTLHFLVDLEGRMRGPYTSKPDARDDSEYHDPKTARIASYVLSEVVLLNPEPT